MSGNAQLSVDIRTGAVLVRQDGKVAGRVNRDETGVITVNLADHRDPELVDTSSSRRDLLRQIGLRPRWSSLPALDRVLSRSYGLFAPPTDQTKSQSALARRVNAIWCWPASLPMLVVLAAQHQAGWVAGQGTWATAELRPANRTSAEKARFAAALIYLGVPLPVLATLVVSIVAAVLSIASGQAWIAAAAGVATIGPGVLDDIPRVTHTKPGLERAISAAADDRTYLVSALATWPHGAGLGDIS